MTFDFYLDPGKRDLRPGWASGSDEIAQRLITRLQRELGEWFLNTRAGLPWYGDTGGRIRDRAKRLAATGTQGILGSKTRTRRATDLLVRREALETEGVERVLSMNTLYSADTRTYSVYMELFITGAGAVSLTLTADADTGCITCRT